MTNTLFSWVARTYQRFSRQVERLVSVRQLFEWSAYKLGYGYVVNMPVYQIDRHEIKMVELRSEARFVRGYEPNIEEVRRHLLRQMFADIERLMEVRELDRIEMLEQDQRVRIFRSRLFIGAR